MKERKTNKNKKGDAVYCLVSFMGSLICIYDDEVHLIHVMYDEEVHFTHVGVYFNIMIRSHFGSRSFCSLRHC